MDPNETLREIRELLASVNEIHTLDEHETDRLAELFEALDQWLTAAGFLPESWCHAVRKFDANKIAEEIRQTIPLYVPRPPERPAKLPPRCDAAHRKLPLHPCPYKHDINGDTKTLCDCCELCTSGCTHDI